MRSSAHESGDPPAWTTTWILRGTRGQKATISSPEQSPTHRRPDPCPRGNNPRGKVETDSGGISAQVEFVPGGATKTGCASLTTLRGEKDGWTARGGRGRGRSDGVDDKSITRHIGCPARAPAALWGPIEPLVSCQSARSESGVKAPRPRSSS